MDWTFVFLAVLIGSIFLWDETRRMWRENEWKRRWRAESRGDQMGSRT